MLKFFMGVLLGAVLASAFFTLIINGYIDMQDLQQIAAVAKQTSKEAAQYGSELLSNFSKSLEDFAK